MATTTINNTYALGAIALLLTITIYSQCSTKFEDRSFVVRFVVNKVWGFFLGRKTLTWAEERRGYQNLVDANDFGEDPDLETTEGDMLEDVLKEVKGELVVVRRKPRRRMRMPYVYYLLNHCRGELGQLDYTQANVKWVERTARAEAHGSLVRSSDLARILPHVVSLYFGSRDGSQSLASRDQQSSAYVESIRATHERRGAGGAGARMSTC